MMTFREKVVELLNMPQELVETEAAAFLETVGEWPVNTEVTLSRVAYLLAGLLREPDPNVRRVRISESIRMKDYAG